MKKIILSISVFGMFLLYALHLRTDNEQIVVGGPKVAGTTPLPNTQTGTTNTTITIYKDGTYTGPTTDAFYGNVQVRVTVSGGKISDVQFLQSPGDRRTSVEINAQAMPMLKSEAIQNQTAQVDIISGATQTSEAFVQSMQSALDQAKI